MIEKDFLKNFEQRMKFVGRYALLCSNSFGKQQWKDYGIETRDEQMNMLFTLLLFIMEYSLREEKLHDGRYCGVRGGHQLRVPCEKAEL